MQEKVQKGVVLRAIDWGEKDKILTVFTLESGKISITLRGVRQLKSKMKFASQPLCFAEFNVAGRGDILTCTGASEIESFFDITKDYDKIVYASTILEMVDSVTTVNEPNPPLFLDMIKALAGMCDIQINSGLVLVKFVLSLFENAGYSLNFSRCKNCGNEFQGGARLVLNSGQIDCLLCDDGNNSILISPQVLANLKILSNLDYNELAKLKVNDEVLHDMLYILITNFSYRFNRKIKSLKI